MPNQVMNNTKWDEVRLAMHALDPSPAWSALSTNGRGYGADRECFYHFRNGGFKDIIHLDIHFETSCQRELIRSALKKIHLPGEETADCFRVLGYVEHGQATEYI